MKDVAKTSPGVDLAEARAAGADEFTPLPRRQVLVTMAGLMLALFLAALDSTIVGTAMPRIIADLGGFDKFTWVTTAYLMTSTAVVPIVGKLSDVYGRKAFYLGGITVFLLGSVLAGFSQGMNQLIVSRAIQGIGGGILFANAFISIGDLFPPAERGKYMGLVSATFGVSSIIGPILGGFITDALSWHWVFFVNLPIGMLVAVLFVRFFPDLRPFVGRHRMDYVGVALLLLAVATLILGLSWGGIQYAWSSPQVVGALAVAAGATALFIANELRVEEPIMPLSIYRNPVVSVSLLAVLFSGFGMFAGPIFIPLYFQGVLGESATGSGGILTPMMLGTVTGAATSGQLMSRLGGQYKRIGLFGLALFGVGLFLTSRLDQDSGHGFAIGTIVLMGFGLGVSLPTYALAVQNAVPYRQLGVATSAVQFVRSIGGTIGLAVLGSLMASRFAGGIASSLSPEVRGAVPGELLTGLGKNPRAIVDPQAMAQLQEALGKAGADGPNLAQQVVEGLRASLAGAIGDVFLVALGAVALAFVVTLFLKDVPLKRGGTSSPAPGPAAGPAQEPPAAIAGQARR